MKPYIILRRLSQIFFLAAFIYVLWAAANSFKNILHPKYLFLFDPLAMISVMLSERQILTGIIWSIFLIVFAIIFGRFFCAWVCPMGTFIDLFDSISVKKIKHAVNLRILKYVLLGIVLLLAVIGLQISWPIDPIVIFGRFVSMNLIPAVAAVLNMLGVELIKITNYNTVIIDFYNTLRSSILGIQTQLFNNTIAILLSFVLIIALSVITKRFWCRYLCPLGAFYGCISMKSLLKRYSEPCSKCATCTSNCRMNAINKDMTTKISECILCMDCIYDCPEQRVSFGFKSGNIENRSKGLSRKNFLFLLAAGLLSGCSKQKNDNTADTEVIRPPGALNEDIFKNRCIRCGNCMRACVTNGLQPVFLESGLDGIWTPRLVPEIGYCEYNCTLCGEVCPTGAIPKLNLDQKHNTRLGLASIDKKICKPWADGTPCIVCQEHCPISTKAIKLETKIINGKTIQLPYIDPEVCVGCGICQNKCPVVPVKAIRIFPLNN